MIVWAGINGIVIGWAEMEGLVIVFAGMERDGNFDWDRVAK